MTTVNLGAAAGLTAAARLIDRFMPVADVRERHEILIHAPARIVFEVARAFDMQSIPLVRAIFWLRERLMGATRHPQRRPLGIVAETLGLGWGILTERPGRALVMGAAAQPWKADVRFTAIPPDRFATFAGPDLVKIAWTFEAEPIEPALTLFRTETRVLATDQDARRKFRRYWRLAGWGILAIRWLLLPALRREVERLHRAGKAAG